MSNLDEAARDAVKALIAAETVSAPDFKEALRSGNVDTIKGRTVDARRGVRQALNRYEGWLLRAEGKAHRAQEGE